MPDWWWKCTAGACKALESVRCRLFGHDVWEAVDGPDWCARCGEWWR